MIHYPDHATFPRPLLYLKTIASLVGLKVLHADFELRERPSCQCLVQWDPASVAYMRYGMQRLGPRFAPGFRGHAALMWG